MIYCTKCATPLDPAERARMATREQSAMEEVKELRGLLKQYLKGQSPRNARFLQQQASTESRHTRPTSG